MHICRCPWLAFPRPWPRGDRADLWTRGSRRSLAHCLTGSAVLGPCAKLLPSLPPSRVRAGILHGPSSLVKGGGQPMSQEVRPGGAQEQGPADKRGRARERPRGRPSGRGPEMGAGLAT